jgi:tetratricopeptide (TPR) repeat protein
VECKLWLYALRGGGKPNMNEVWKTYDEYVKVSPVNVQEFDKLKGRLMVGLAFLRADQPDSAKALAAANQGNADIDPRGDLTNYAASIYFQAGDKDKALELIAKYLALNPNQRAFAAKDQSWWLEGLRSDPRYQALVKSSN